jgi:hypothetical protein
MLCDWATMNVNSPANLCESEDDLTASSFKIFADNKLANLPRRRQVHGDNVFDREFLEMFGQGGFVNFRCFVQRPQHGLSQRCHIIHGHQPAEALMACS